MRRQRHRWWLRFVREKWFGLAYAVVLALILQRLEFAGWFASIEGHVLDILFQPGSLGTESRIVTVEIDDLAYAKCFGSNSPLDAQTVVNLVKQVATAEPLVIGVDILTDTDVNSVYRGSRESLSGRRTVWVSGLADLPASEPSFSKWLMGAPDPPKVTPSLVLGGKVEELPADVNWGLPVFPREDDLRVRRLPRAFTGGAGWARKVAEKYCKLAPWECTLDDGKGEIFFSYEAAAPARFSVHDLFRCSGNAEIAPGLLWDRFQEKARRNIVLIGGTFAASRDSYHTPAGPLPGLIVNAYAIEGELTGSGIREGLHLVTFLFDIAIGWLIVLIFWPPASHMLIEEMRRRKKLPAFAAFMERNRIRCMIGASLALIPAGMVFTQVGVFLLRFLWLSWIGVAIGMVPHVIFEIWEMNPRVPDD